MVSQVTSVIVPVLTVCLLTSLSNATATATVDDDLWHKRFMTDLSIFIYSLPKMGLNVQQLSTEQHFISTGNTSHH